MLTPLPILDLLLALLNFGKFDISRSVPAHNASHDHVGDAVGRGLQGGSDGHGGSPDDNGLLSSQLLANPESDDGSEETSDIIDSCDNSERVRIARAVEVMNVEVILRYIDAAWRGQKTQWRQKGESY